MFVSQKNRKLFGPKIFAGLVSGATFFQKCLHSAANFSNIFPRIAPQQSKLESHTTVVINFFRASNCLHEIFSSSCTVFLGFYNFSISYVALIYFGPKGRENNGGVNPPGVFLVTPPSGRGLVTPVFFYPAVRTGSSNTHFFFRGFFFWWSLAPDLRFSLGQTNTRRVFHYTGKGFYLE